ncbi:MAG: hypothetical protein ABI867_23310 [Kofleriaceae bacterium]
MLRTWPLVLLVACTVDPVPDNDLDPGGGKDDRGDSGGFSEVDATHSTLTFRRYVEAAIAALERDPSELAQLTAKAIRDRWVHLDELVDLTCWDFERARADLPGANLTAADYQRLHDRGSPVAKALTDALDGYMWSNRIYVSRGQTVKRLAATLIHEVNHVVNRSEVGYYDDLPTSAFIHEYRAFYAENEFDPDEYAGIDLVDYVIENYELDRSKIHAAMLAAPLTPRLLPDAAAWKNRRVQDDARDDDAACPANL